MIAARRGNDVALTSDLPCEASHRAGDCSGAQLAMSPGVACMALLTLVNLAEEHNSGEAAGGACKSKSQDSRVED